ncbi:hypothetical protein N7523_005813 [Penicillium sp. IBT 18751x]|nr:hypothetical protein N7523_005813 [Penicillium sp. IBT 18751x]
MISIQTSEQKTWKNDENRNIVPEPQAGGALAAGGAAAPAEAVAEEKEEYELAWELDGRPEPCLWDFVLQTAF